MSSDAFRRSELTPAMMAAALPPAALAALDGTEAGAALERLVQRAQHVQRRQNEIKRGRSDAEAADRSAAADAMLKGTKPPASKVQKLDAELAGLIEQEPVVTLALRRALNDALDALRPDARTMADEAERGAAARVQSAQEHVEQAAEDLAAAHDGRVQAGWLRALDRGDPRPFYASTSTSPVLNLLTEATRQIVSEERKRAARAAPAPVEAAS